MSPYALRFVAGYFFQRFKLRGLVLAKQPDIAPLLRRHRIMNWFTTFCPSPVQVEQDRGECKVLQTTASLPEQAAPQAPLIS